MSTNRQLILDKIKSANKIIITTHEYPDADGIGSQISLCLALKGLGKECFCVNEENLLDRYRYLDPEVDVLSLNQFQEKYADFPVDLIIVVDTNTILRVGNHFKDQFQQHNNIIYIDHHPCAQAKAGVHLVETSAAATGQLVGELIKELGIAFNKKIALPLYTAILIDTSSFRYPNVSASTHRLVAELMATGINPPKAYNGIYGTKKVPHMHLLGKILSSANCNEREDIAWLVIDVKDLISYGTDVEDTHAFINNLLVLDNIKVACMFRDDGPAVKISFRSSGDIDVGVIARSLGGGGHSHSAATIIKKENKTLEKIIQDSITQIEKTVDALS
jgi:bifunctional oligoribonuclease and PAP phosphatase NrnA